MNKKITNSLEYNDRLNGGDIVLSRLMIKRNSTRRRVNTEIEYSSEGKGLSYSNRLQPATAAYKYFSSNQSGKKAKQHGTMTLKKCDKIQVNLAPLQIKNTLPKSIEIKSNRLCPQRAHISSGIRYIMKRQQQVKKYAKVKTQIDQDTSQQRLQQIYKKLSSIKVSRRKEQKLLPQNRYRIEETVGKGTFGVVFKGTDIVAKECVAIKKVLQDNRYKNRELTVMKILKHPNVLELRDHYYLIQNEEEYLHLVVDYYNEDLYRMIQKRFKRGQFLRSIFVKIYAYQLFTALEYLSSVSVAHRDIKPHNILINPQNNKLVICDFGSAKQLIESMFEFYLEETNLAYICSRCYRAPELIFGSTNYSPQIDMWSVGCVLVQMINGQPPFIGGSQLDQLIQIMRVLGTPTEEEVLEMNSDYDMKNYRFPTITRKEWKKILRLKTDKMLVDLIEKVMEYSPHRRLTPTQALSHQYFNDIRDDKMRREIIRVTGCSTLEHSSSSSQL